MAEWLLFGALVLVGNAHAALVVTGVTYTYGTQTAVGTVYVTPSTALTANVTVTNTGQTWAGTGRLIDTSNTGLACSNNADTAVSPSTIAIPTTSSATVGTNNAYFAAYTNNTCTTGASATFTSTGTVIVDNVVPTIPTATIASSNASPTWAKTGDVITLTFTVADNNLLVRTPVVTIRGGAAVVAGSYPNFTATRTMLAADTAGVVPFTINVTDLAGNAAAQRTTVTSGSSVTFDKTIPTITPATMASNNSTTTLAKVGDTVTLSFTTNDANSVQTPVVTISGSAATVVATGGPVTAKTWTASRIMDGSEPSGAVTFTINVSDLASNPAAQRTAVTSGAAVTFDKTLPTLTTVTITSNNAVNAAYARTGRTITLSFTASESVKATPVVTIAGNAATEAPAGPSAGPYTATYVMAAGDTEGVIPFTINFIDLAGNAGTTVTTTTNASSVTFDKTLPTVGSIDRVGSSPTNAATVQWTANFSETVVGVTTARFGVVNTGLGGAPAVTLATAGPGTAWTVTASTGTGNGTLGLNLTSVTGVTDLAGNIPAPTLPVVGQVYTLDRTVPTLTPVTIASNNANPALAAVGDTVTVTFTANESVQATPTVTIAGHAVTPSPAGPGAGPYTASWVMTGADTFGVVPFTINFTDLAGNAGVQVTATTNASSVNFQNPTKLGFSVQPSSAASSVAISPSIVVQIQNPNNSVATTSTAAVTLAIAANPGGGTLSGTLTVNAVAGVATFNNVKIDKAGTGYTLTATSGSLTSATSSTFNITAGAASQLAILQQPSNTAISASISPAITVQVLDAAGNLTADTRTINITKSGCGGTLGGTASIAAVAGVATFSTLSINAVGTGCLLTAASTTPSVLTSAPSTSFDITALAASKLAFSVQPSKAAPNASISPAITVLIQDSASVTITSSTAIVTMAIGTNPGSGTLAGTVSVAAVAGVATFSNLAINNVGTGYTLTASSSGLTGATSNAFNITTATKLAFFQQPSNIGATYTISPAVTVQIQNASSALVTTSTDTVTLAIGNNAGPGGVLSGTLSAAAVAGVATFSNLSIDLPGTAYTLTANANTPGAGLTGDTSVAFNITAPVCFTDTFNRATLLGTGDWTRTKGAGTALDAEIVGGRLQLTDNAGNRATAVHLNRLFPGFGNKVTAEFDYYAYNGNGADGLVLTLSDASIAPVAGAFGGSLGYAQKCQSGVSGCTSDCNVSGGCPGFTGGWIGVGLDEFGNYSNPTEGRVDGPGVLADAITIRGSGSGQSGYNYHTRAAAPGGVDVAGATPGPGHRYRVTVDHSDGVHAYTSVDRDSTTKDGTSYVNIIPVYDSKAIGTQAGVPTNWFFSFTASTGGSNNIHEIANLKVCTPNPQVVPVLDHVRIIHDGSALTCAPETITLKACANASCSALYTGSVTVNLSAPGATASLSNPVTISGGQVQLTLTKATAGTVTLGGAVTSPSSLTAVCYNGATVNDCSLVYSSNACTFDAVEVGLNPGAPIYTKLSGTAFSVDVLALTAGVINTAFNTAVTVDLVDQTGVAAGSCGTTSLASPTNAPAWASGRRTYNFNYANAARDVRVRVVQTTPPVTACSSDNFAIRPTSFTVTSPNATNTASTGTPTFRAGTTVFGLDAAALTGYTGSALLNNYRVSAHAGAVQSGSVNWPANTSPFAAASSGSGWASKGTAFTYSDVGNFQLLPWGVYDDGSFADVDRSKSECFTDGNKLGTNLNPVDPNVKDGNGKYGCYFGNTANSVFFGRFIPDHFAITTPVLTAACTTIIPFTYFGQDFFTTAFTLTAQNANNATTANYTGATWAKLGLTTWANYVFSAATLPAGSLLTASATPPIGTWTNGSAAVTAKHQISRPTALSSPATITISALPADTDGTTMASATSIGLSLQRYGRLYLKDATVPALVNPQVDALLQYYDTTIAGGPWQNNVDDSSCTSIAANMLQIGSIVKPGSSLLAFGTPPTGVAVSQTSPGKWKITLTPTTRGDGRANILFNLGGAVGTTGCSTLTSPVGGAAPASSLAYLADNCGSGSYNKSSTATVTFGTKKSVLIYLREKH